MESMQEAVQHRCEEHSDHRDEGDAAEQGVEAGEDVQAHDLRARQCRIGWRAFTGEDHRRVVERFFPAESPDPVIAAHPDEQSGSALEIKDTRTSKTYTIQVADDAVRATELKKIKTDDPDDLGLVSYDPAFLNTASCRSAITYIDGDKGILRYRGYPIEQLAENATFLEVAWLLRDGDLPTKTQYSQWVHDVTFHTYVHENIKNFLTGFRYNAHPMSMLCS